MQLVLLMCGAAISNRNLVFGPVITSTLGLVFEALLKNLIRLPDCQFFEVNNKFQLMVQQKDL